MSNQQRADGPWNGPINQVLATPAADPGDGSGVGPAAFRSLVAADVAGALLVAGVAAGYKIARGVAAVTGTADITTGLATVVAVVATAASDFAIGLNGVTAVIGGTAGHVTLKCWKPTASGDCTPIAATAAENVNWVAIGT